MKRRQMEEEEPPPPRRGCRRLVTIVTVLALSALLTGWVVGLHNNKSKAPSESQTASPVAPPVAPHTGYCSDMDCLPDYFGHLTPMYAGQALCHAQYRLELTLYGVFRWKDCSTGRTKVFYEGQMTHFELSAHGVLQLYDNDVLVWQQDSYQDIHPSLDCNHNPPMDCPHIHLHKGGGALVLNWESDGEWVARDFRHIYGNLYEE